MQKSTVPKLDHLNQLFRSGAFDELESQLNLFLKKNPHSLNALNLLGLVEYNRGNINPALDIFEKLHKKNPKNPFFLGNLGLLLNVKGDSSLAIPALTQALALQSDDAKSEHTILTLGLAQKSLGLNEEALKSFRRGAVVKGKLKGEFQTQIAHLLRIERRYQEAVDAFEKIDIRDSKTHQLECIYRLKNKSLYREQAAKLVTRGDSNPLLGALISHSNKTIDTQLQNPFCKTPLNFIFKGMIPSQKLTDDLIETLVEYSLNNENGDLHQDLLKNGHQTNGNLLNSGQPFVLDLKKIITGCINHYRKKFSGKPEPFLKKWPQDFEVSAWLVNIKPNGQLGSHMHKEGWLSGSIYLDVPQDTNTVEGGISFSLDGANLPTFNSQFSQTSVSVRKREVLMFPSSLFHKTLSFGGIRNRVSLGFDVMPK